MAGWGPISLSRWSERGLTRLVQTAKIGAGNWRGPFHGVPLGLKDNLYTKGVLTTAGSKVLADFRPDFDATAWAKLASQGAVLLGKLNLNEFCLWGTAQDVP
jgi:aspartyl-tRNA(Asn)/glutamyl-tRNA(Gln) amidotransferase subunit A